MALIDILEAIAKQADDYAAEVSRDAQCKIEALGADAKKEQSMLVEAFAEKKAQAREDMQRRQSSTLAQMEKTLRTTQQKKLIDEVFANVLVRLQKMKGDPLEKIFENILSQISFSKGVIVVLGSGKTEVESVLKKLKKDKDFSLEEKKGTGGFLVLADGAEVDFSYESLVGRYLRSRYEGEVKGLLFSE